MSKFGFTKKGIKEYMTTLTYLYSHHSSTKSYNVPLSVKGSMKRTFRQNGTLTITLKSVDRTFFVLVVNLIRTKDHFDLGPFIKGNVWETFRHNQFSPE